MKKFYSILLVCLFAQATYAQINYVAGRMKEVFRQTILVDAAANLRDPWEITYGPDDSLWVTEASAGSSNSGGTAVTAGTTGYKVVKIHPVTGGRRTILDLTTFTDAASTPTNKWQKKFTPGLLTSPQPSGTTTFKVPSYQGGLMGLALHPEFMTNPAKRFVYIAYGHDHVVPSTASPLITTNPNNGEAVKGNYFNTWLVRFTYNNAGLLVNPVALCDTIPGSNDHNSGRIIIVPEGGTNYLYYAVGDVGAGQFANIDRTIKAQATNSYEGKILRFNLEPDGDAGTFDRWIPNSNPYNNVAPVSGQSAVWAIGIRNNQGFAFGNINGTDRFYGASHGPFSDDEINLLQNAKNYGHPLVIGYSADDNYRMAKAGPISSSLPLITSEITNAAAIGSSYMDPIYANYAADSGSTTTFLPKWSIQYIYNNVDTNPSPSVTVLAQNANGAWKSEGYSGLGLYTGTAIPGWKNSVLPTCLKGARILRMKLNANGDGIVPTDGADTVSYFGSTNRFRDIAFSPSGRDIFVALDRSGSSSGPSSGNPIVPACGGCIQKYTFLGYNDDGSGFSTIPTSIPVDAGVQNNCAPGTTVIINAANNNNNIWVPITGPDGNIVAEIKANGNNLDTVTASLFTRIGSSRQDPYGRKYLNRNIRITPKTQPATAVSLRLYISADEFNAFNADMGNGLTISNVGVFKNNDNCSAALIATAAPVTTAAKQSFGSNGYVLQTNTLSSFSSFYFASSAFSLLPFNLITFKGALKNGATQLQWSISSQQTPTGFVVERSNDLLNYEAIGTVMAQQSTSSMHSYTFTDADAGKYPSPLYYRLKATYTNNEFQYSNTVKISFGAVTSAFASLYPNPATNKVTVLVNTNGAETGWLSILTSTGHVIRKQNISLNSGRNTIDVSIADLPAGIYYVDINTKSVTEKIKLIKK
jgi:trimeric autotransporter adhesin